MDKDYKFENCMHRSLEKEDLSEGCCGNRKNLKGYICWKIAIENVIALHCEKCEFFKNKHDEGSKGSNGLDPFA